MLNLVILNGACGVGKSTAAEVLHKSMPLCYLISGDRMRKCVNGYAEFATESRALAARVTLSTIETCLSAGHDVILDKMLFKESLLDSFVEMGIKHGAKITEIILWAPKEIVLQRALERGYRPGGLLTPEKADRFWDEINALRGKRPQASVIDVTDPETVAVVQKIRSLIEAI